MVAKHRYKISWIRLVASLCLVGLGAVGGFFYSKAKAEPPAAPTAVKPVPTAAERAKALLGQMTLEEKVGQLFLVMPEAVDQCGVDVVEPCVGFKEGQAKYNVGGLILFDRNMKNPEQLRKLIASFQKNSKYPLFIAVDEEGGRVARLGNNPAFRQELLAIGPMSRVGKAEEAHDVGLSLGYYLKDFGFNLDFAPVADVLINPDNREIGDRSFGGQAELCGSLAAQVVKGLQQRQVMATLKHFPGHGGYESDSHEGLSVSQRSLEELRGCELVAFKKGMEAEPACVMVAHLSLPKVSKSGLPASLDKYVVTDLLKKELGYQGLVVSDALNMGAIVEHYGVAEAAVKSFNAGVDVLLMPGELAKAYNGIRQGVEQGTISKERLDEAVGKILLAKVSYGISK